MFIDLYVHDGRRRVFWNLNSAVGLHARNAPDDLEFIRWAFRFIADRQRPIQRTLRDALAAAGIDKELVPNPDEVTPTVRGIMAFSMFCHHRTLETEADHRISPARGVSHSKGFYTIIHLNLVLMRLLPNAFPRLDLESSCPPAVRSKMRWAFNG